MSLQLGGSLITSGRWYGFDCRSQLHKQNMVSKVRWSLLKGC